MENYEKIRKIGKGNFGEVLLVKKREDGKFYALKRQHVSNYESNTKHSPDNEVKILRGLSHPNIIRYYQCFNHKQKFCFLMEYADGGDLLERVKAAKKYKYSLDQDMVIGWFAQICLAIKYLHDNNILHRDIKVQNVFLMKSGLLKLGDFGISKILENANDMAQTSLGTPYYLSPEILSSSAYNHKSDVWMLGCLLYELCSLEKPFFGDSIHGIIKKITTEEPAHIPEGYSPFVWNLIRILLIKNPEKRPSINDVLECPEIKQKVLEAIKSFPEYESFESPYSKERLPAKPPAKENSNADKNGPGHQQMPPVKGKLTPIASDSHISPLVPQVKALIPESRSQEDIKTEKNKAVPGVMAVNSIHYLIQKARKLTNVEDLEKQGEAKEEQKPLSKSAVPMLNISQNNGLEEERKERTDKKGPISAGRRVSKTMSINFTEEEDKLQGSTSPTKSSFISPVSRETLRQNLPALDGGSAQKPASSRLLEEDKKKVNFSKSTTPLNSAQNNKFSVVKLFDSRESVTPARAMLMMDFVKQRVGQERFEKLQGLMAFSSTGEVEKLFEERKSAIQSILGEENSDLLKLLKLHALTVSGQPLHSAKEPKFSVTASDQPINKFRKATDYQYEMHSPALSTDSNSSNRKKTSSEDAGMN